MFERSRRKTRASEICPLKCCAHVQTVCLCLRTRGVCHINHTKCTCRHGRTFRCVGWAEKGSPGGRLGKSPSVYWNFLCLCSCVQNKCTNGRDCRFGPMAGVVLISFSFNYTRVCVVYVECIHIGVQSLFFFFFQKCLLQTYHYDMVILIYDLSRKNVKMYL